MNFRKYSAMSSATFRRRSLIMQLCKCCKFERAGGGVEPEAWNHLRERDRGARFKCLCTIKLMLYPLD